MNLGAGLAFQFSDDLGYFSLTLLLHSRSFQIVDLLFKSHFGIRRDLSFFVHDHITILRRLQYFTDFAILELERPLLNDIVCRVSAERHHFAGAGQEFEARTRQRLDEQVALALVERRQFEVWPRVGHVRGQGVLHRRVDREHVELVDLAEFGRQRRRGGDVADLPAGDVVGLAEARDDEAACRQFGMARRALQTFVRAGGVGGALTAVRVTSDEKTSFTLFRSSDDFARALDGIHFTFTGSQGLGGREIAGDPGSVSQGWTASTKSLQAPEINPSQELANTEQRAFSLVTTINGLSSIPGASRETSNGSDWRRCSDEGARSSLATRVSVARSRKLKKTLDPCPLAAVTLRAPNQLTLMTKHFTDARILANPALSRAMSLASCPGLKVGTSRTEGGLSS